MNILCCRTAGFHATPKLPNSLLEEMIPCYNVLTIKDISLSNG